MFTKAERLISLRNLRPKKKEGFLKIISNGYVAGIFGAALSHIIADVIASYLDPHIRSMILGIVIGGLIPLAFIPLLERFVTKSKNHIVIGDHEDIKKDLDSH